VRTRLEKLGFALRRSRRRDPLRFGYGFYHVIEISSDSIRADVPYSLAGIERFAEEMEEAELPRETRDVAIAPGPCSCPTPTEQIRRHDGSQSDADPRQLELPFALADIDLDNEKVEAGAP
jgi:hypothetical protein